MELIKNAVLTLLEDLKAKKKDPGLFDPEVLLKKVFAPKELGHIKFCSVKNGVLTIEVDSSVWIYYLNLQKKRILTRLDEKATGIKDIRFKIGGRKNLLH